jgi:nicotinamide mononucleotide adenylyltransferase
MRKSIRLNSTGFPFNGGILKFTFTILNKFQRILKYNCSVVISYRNLDDLSPKIIWVYIIHSIKTVPQSRCCDSEVTVLRKVKSCSGTDLQAFRRDNLSQSSHSSTLKKNAAISFETFVRNYQTTPNHVPEYHRLLIPIYFYVPRNSTMGKGWRQVPSLATSNYNGKFRE